MIIAEVEEAAPWHQEVIEPACTSTATAPEVAWDRRALAQHCYCLPDPLQELKGGPPTNEARPGKGTSG